MVLLLDHKRLCPITQAVNSQMLVTYMKYNPTISQEAEKKGEVHFLLSSLPDIIPEHIITTIRQDKERKKKVH